MLERLHADGGPERQSLDALDEFLAAFVNEGSASAPLYARGGSAYPTGVQSPRHRIARCLAQCPVLHELPLFGTC